MIRPSRGTVLVWGIVGLTLVLHLVAALASPYGFHRDELLYLALGRHLRFWSMDVPPGIGVFANVARALFGDTLFAVRFWPAVGHAALVGVAAEVARRLGGSGAAQALAATSVGLAPIFLGAGSLFQPVVFDQVWWTLGLLALLDAALTGRRRGYVWLGVVCGLGLLTKLSILFFGLAVLGGLLASRQRRDLLTPWPYVAAAVALLVGSATLVGQIRLGFPVVGQMSALNEAQLDRVTVGAFGVGQVRMLGPALVLALVGATSLLRSENVRAVGWASVGAVALLMLTHGKAYYAGPVYPVLIGAGAAALGGWSARGARAAMAAAFVLVVAYGAVTFPFAVPIVPPAPMARYAARFEGSTETNWGERLALPQDYADMLGWEEQVRKVAEAFRSLSPADQARAVVVARNYGEAGALDLYGPRYGLPPVVCAHTSFWFFGPGERPGDVAVGIGLEPDDLAPLYGSVRVVGRTDAPWAVPEERAAPIVVAREPRHTVQEVWPSLAGNY